MYLALNLLSVQMKRYYNNESCMIVVYLIYVTQESVSTSSEKTRKLKNEIDFLKKQKASLQVEVEQMNAKQVGLCRLCNIRLYLFYI